MPTTITPTAIAERLRAVAGFLDHLPADLEVQPVVGGTAREVTFPFSAWTLPIDFWRAGVDEEARGAEQKRRFKLAARAIGGRWVKNDPTSSPYDDATYTFTHADGIRVPGQDEPVRIVLTMPRDVVCERVQVGTTTKIVPAVEAAPERIEQVPVFVRDCKPLFAEPHELAELTQELEAGVSA